MRKIIIGLSGIVLVAFIVVLVANASTGDPKDAKKAITEVSKDCGKCPSAAACADKAEAKTAEAKPCSASEKAPCAATAEAKKCDEAKPCCASKK
ncbi:MAG: hypothetical protein A2X05_12825 [Bacteroidetes bacterium GWE2_41_25]|nr:MAG: hypothetical protein A2X03_09385 [Bacteroidetes bacterium GWA2_40_15]OFX92920.1 MAG: hypothetical protein A2X06_16015 [Bacteroidetes bacterium GWC2_40_22]OFY09380.1 MAG: hypothetical protein A2X05_12825 [Bacteroidetes bacterium GWE2_41_25]OFY59613.1 MAG: hypothetical protein A2X04_17095 [Bacteroidetes bacterium GWF2_41_9]HAM10359.1 hypothetical protein [Bacteroidales bacterium]